MSKKKEETVRDLVSWDEMQLNGCCGMSEITSIFMMKGHEATQAEHNKAMKLMTEWLDTHNADDETSEGGGYGYWDDDDHYHSDNEEEDEGEFEYGRRLLIASLYSGGKGADRNQAKLIKGLIKAGWKVYEEFPGNHGDYTLKLLGYVPKCKMNMEFLNASANKEPSVVPHSNDGQPVVTATGVQTGTREKARA